MSGRPLTKGQKKLREKQAKMEAMWNDSFELCQFLVQAVKSGDLKVNASTIRELTNFLKVGQAYLDKLKEEEERKIAERRKAWAMKHGKASGDEEREEMEIDISVPFPVRQAMAEPLK
jgi:hypothetical protein